MSSNPAFGAALRWALADGRHLDDAAHLVHDLTGFWTIIGAAGEAVAWIQQILDHPAAATTERVELMLTMGELLSALGDQPAGLVQLERGSRWLGPCAIPACSVDAWRPSRSATNADDGISLATEAQSLAEQLKDDDLAAAAIHILGVLALRVGRYNDAAADFEQSLSTGIYRHHVVGTRDFLAVIHELQGRWQTARDEFLMVESGGAEVGDRNFAAYVCLGLAQVELALQVPDAALARPGAGRDLGRSEQPVPGSSNTARGHRRAVSSPPTATW